MEARVDPDRSEWDVIVLGGAAAGENAAQYATQFSGLDAVLVEAELLGGECSYWACMPSKALLRPAEVLGGARHVPGVSSLLTGRELDVRAVLARRDTVVNGLDDSSQIRWALGVGIDVVRGYGRLTGERSVAVETAAGGTRALTARHAVVIDTGSCTTVPTIPGMSEAHPWTSRDVTNLHEVPRRVVVLGGGVVACEAATWLRALGVEELSVVYRRAGLLARAEPFAGRMVGDRLTAVGCGCFPAGRSPRCGATIPVTRESGCRTAARSPSGWTTGARSSPTNWCSPPAVRRTPRTSACRRWDAPTAASWRSTTSRPCGRWTGTGCTRSVMSADARC